MSFTFTPEKVTDETDKNRALGLIFGVGEYSVFGAYSFGRKRYTIPAGEIIAVEKKAHAISERRKEIQRHAGYRGHGRDRKLLGTVGLAGRPTNIRDALNHKYSCWIVNVAVANKCGVIKIYKDLVSPNANLPEITGYSWSDLVEKLKYKAEEKGVVVEMVALDGDKCYKCGADIDIADESILTCLGCGAKINKDYNTAKRIANG